LHQKIIGVTLSYFYCCLPFDFQEFAGDLEGRERGSLISFETGAVTPFGVVAAQDRGLLIVPPKTEVYENMLIGIHQRPGDLKVNVCKKKALTNMRASGSDDTIKITPAIELSLDSMVRPNAYIYCKSLHERSGDNYLVMDCCLMHLMSR